MRRRRQNKREPTIALINIVFLMLVFFLVAGTLAPPIDPELRLVTTADLPPDLPPDALVLHADGRMTWRGDTVTLVTDYVADLPAAALQSLRVVPDRNAPAATLIQLGETLKNAGAGSVLIVTEKGLQ